ncbi:hypothetical protein [Flindersiella endophytica]
MLTNVPLTTLLSWVWIAHTIEADNAFEALASAQAGRAFRMSLPMWTNGLRFVSEDGVTVSELRGLARADCNLGGLERWGWMSVGDSSDAERRPGYGSFRGINGNSVLRPTKAGSDARRLWPRVLGDVEQRWRARFGAEAVGALRHALLAHLPTTPMPWSPPEVTTTDGYLSQVVPGAAGEDDEQRPLAALLGQVLTAYTLEHEQGAAVSLPLAANLLRAVGSGVVRLRDLPTLTGISKEGCTQAAGYLERNGLATPGPDRTVSLTPDGHDALDDYRRRAHAQPDGGRLHEALAPFVTQQDALTAGLVPPEGCWRGERPYLTRTKRLLENPIAALPWHPFVLARGAWPDAG